MIKKTIIIIMLLTTVNIFTNNVSINADAGIIKWGLKKSIAGIVKIIFSEIKDSMLDKAKVKLFNHIKENPEYLDYTIGLVKRQINKNPRYEERGNNILEQLSTYGKSRIYNKK